jgi:phosphoesterase RecJ-like protein
MKADGKICVLKLRLADLQKYDVMVEDTEGIVDYSLTIEGVKVGIFLKERDANTVKVSLRSQNGIDISKFAILKGGGGHANAAGFTIAMPFAEASNKVIDEVTEFLNG